MEDGRTSGYPQVSNTVVEACKGGLIAGLGYQLSTDSKASWKEYLRSIAVGGVSGCTVGFVVNKRREAFANQAAYYDSEISLTRRVNAELKDVNNHLTARTQANRQALAALEARRNDATLEASATREARNAARADLRWAERQLEAAEDNLEAQQLVLDESTNAISSTAAVQLRQELDTLQQYVSTLEREVDSLASIDDSLGQLAG